MSGLEYLGLGLELWTVIGLLGLTISLVRRERQKLWRGVGSLVGVWVVYLGILLVVSYRQPERRVALGQPVCFDAMCFTVTGVDEVPGFPLRNHVRLVRVTVEVANKGKSEAREDVTATLRDVQGRVWGEAAAVSGNPLAGRVLAGGTVVSEPVFQVATDATGLELVLAHGWWSRHRLVIGDAESFGHRRVGLALGR
ncbi:hypothetical protein [Granulicella arctica]|uniref:DUF4352 domain-containing protein n=1 Tax=Granulicella arctica TaxID=940613 RepID=A0A7Y9PG54_9BACT|nr:hypothetical protein [Granulicella arctica]NYF79276.1 hypothetical protein [Granulicella arctica]